MKTIGLHGLNATVVSLGLAEIGIAMSEEESFHLMDAYLDLGGNFLDTARVYSDWVPGESGRSERIIGDWLAARGNRNRVVLATKGAHPDLENFPNPRMAPAEMEHDINLSLKALRTDVIDLYYLHRDDRGRPVSEILETLERFVQQGKIRRYACSNWRADRMLEAHAYARAHGLAGFDANQIFWSLGSANSLGLEDKTCEAFTGDLRRAFEATGIVAAAYTSQAGGYFTKLEQGRDVSGSIYDTPVNRRVWQVARSVAAESGLSMAEVVLSYILSQPIPTIAVVGCKTIAQLTETMAAADKPLGSDALAELEQAIDQK